MTTSNAISLFNFNTNQVRVATVSGNPWFIAADVCKILGLTNTSKAIADADLHFDEQSNWQLGSGGHPAIIISRSGVNKLILNSRKPAAVQFKDWLAREVIPAIQDDGMYVMGEEKVKTGEMSEDELVLKAMSLLTKKVEKLAAERAALAEEHAAYDRTFNFITTDVFRGLKGN